MKSIYKCEYCKKEQIVEAKKEEKRELIKNSSNLELIYKEKPKDLKFSGYKIKEYFHQLTQDLKTRFDDTVISKKDLEKYFEEMEFGTKAIIAYQEWIRANGGVVKEKEIMLPN
ncbi:hypothetical protein C9439_02940 [archaeon SCG-AAA382B04]|nr:hypothetical protein C9439_02940 [archaeon SCG-AAA382B04]